MGYYSAIKMNEILLVIGKWMELADIAISEIRQIERQMLCVLIHCGS
jgi:hypothetical protein